CCVRKTWSYTAGEMRTAAWRQPINASPTRYGEGSRSKPSGRRSTISRTNHASRLRRHTSQASPLNARAQNVCCPDGYWALSSAPAVREYTTRRNSSSTWPTSNGLGACRQTRMMLIPLPVSGGSLYGRGDLDLDHQARHEEPAHLQCRTGRWVGVR